MMLEIVMKFFPRDDLWEVIQPNFKAGAAVDGFVARMVRPPLKRGFEDDDEEDEDMQESGEDFKEIIKIPIEMLVLKEEE